MTPLMAAEERRAVTHIEHYNQHDRQGAIDDDDEDIGEDNVRYPLQCNRSRYLDPLSNYEGI